MRKPAISLKEQKSCGPINMLSAVLIEYSLQFLYTKFKVSSKSVAEYPGAYF